MSDSGYTHSWECRGQARAALAIVHGFGEHGGRYEDLAGFLADRGVDVAAADLRGHGRSPGRRGHVRRWSDYRDDVEALLGRLSRQHPELPLFLYGHSMGALVVLEYAIRRPVGLAGLVSSAVPLVPTNVASPSKIAAANLLSRLWPSFPMRLRLDTSALSRDPAVVRAYEEDPLVHDRGTARWGVEVMAVTRWISDNGGELSVPLLLIHGAADRIASPAGSRQLHDMLGGASSVEGEATSTLRVYDDAFHEPHNDLDRESVWADIAIWIDEQRRSLQSLPPAT